MAYAWLGRGGGFPLSMKQPSETTPEGRGAEAEDAMGELVEEVMADEADGDELEFDAGVTTGVEDEPADDEE